MIIRSAEEAKAEYQRAMGRQIGPVFYALMAEVHYLHVKWGDYTALFDKEKRVELLNQVAPAYFARLQDMYVHDTFLHISRLTDVPKKGRYRRLTISGLVGMIEVPELRRKLRPMVADMNRKAKALRTWRNRRIAHTEYELALGQATEPLPRTTRAMTRSAIEAIAAVLHAVCKHYCDSDHRPALVRWRCCTAWTMGSRRRDARIAARDYRPEDLEIVDL